MKNKILCLLLISSAAANCQLQPVITSWVINTTGATGYDGIPSNVQIVQYSDSSAYISATCIPGYDIGPWSPDPNTAKNQNFVFKLTRYPQKNSGTLTQVGLGHTGVWSNGVSIFNASDGMTYNNDGVWHRNAYYFEGNSFDDCLGHPEMHGEYHHHVSPKCLYNSADSTHHSPIIGYMFDGYPIYGAYGYADTNGTGGIKRMTPSYQLRHITARDTLPNGTAASVIGPVVSDSLPLGDFLEDYVYIPGSGDLDNLNGRFCVTPEYPNGIYAYFVTIDSALNPVYPYTSGNAYYGVVNDSDVGPGSGHITITESTTRYNPDTTSAINEVGNHIKFEIAPNPAKNYTYIYFDPISNNNISGKLYNEDGLLVQTFQNMQPSITYTINLTNWSSGNYILKLESGSESVVQKIVKVK